MRFTDLPLGSKKALIQYFVLDAFEQDFYNIIKDMPQHDLSESMWQNLIMHADIEWANKDFSLSRIPAREAYEFVMRHTPDVAQKYGSFEEYQLEYCSLQNPAHKDIRWPVLAMPSCGEALIDGWNRLSSYYISGASEILFINLDEVAIEENKKYQI